MIGGMSDSHATLWDRWRSTFAGTELTDTIPDHPVRRAGSRLQRGNAVRIHELELSYIEAQVQVQSSSPQTQHDGTVDVSLAQEEDRLSHRCTCAASARPCEHVAAVIYEVLRGTPDAHRPQRSRSKSNGAETEPPANEASGPSVDDAPPEALPKPGALQRTYSLSTDGPESHRAIAWVDMLFPERRNAKAPPGTVMEPDGTLRNADQTAIRTQKRFRPAFELRFSRELGPQGGWILKPVLVTMRSDGTDGKLEEYRPSKPRFRGDSVTEELYAALCRQEQPQAPFVRVLQSWVAAGYIDPEATVPPVELYVERDTLDAPRRAQLRRLDLVTLNWQLALDKGKRPRLVPVAHLQSSEGASETTCEELPELRGRYAEAHESAFILPVPETGSVWFLISRPSIHQALSGILNLRDLSLTEARRLAKLCSVHLSGLVATQTPPNELPVQERVPTPIFSITHAHRNMAFARLLFRYGTATVSQDAPESYFPANDEWALFARLTRVENLMAVRLRDLLRQMAESFDLADSRRADSLTIDSEPADPEPTDYEPASSDAFIEQTHGPEGPELRIAAPPSVIIRAVGDQLLSLGFEILLWGQKVRVADGSTRFRVVNSGNGWLEIEAGVLDEGRFVPLQRPPSGGIASAEGATYVFREREELEAFLQNDARLRVDSGDLATLSTVYHRLTDTDHDALGPFRELREKLQQFDRIEPVDPPPQLHGTLREYQRAGLTWLWFLHRQSLGGCLADDMGLGKTVQTLALLLKAREAGEMRRALVVAPVSTLGNWERETARFAPSFRVRVHARRNRADRPDEFSDCDMILVSYATLLRDIELFGDLDIDYLILDEAQAIKNPTTKTRRAVRSLDIPHRIALSGTPIENSTMELWSLIDVLMPGLLGPRSRFLRRYTRPIEDEGNQAVREHLLRVVRPLILRRRKRDVTPELPEREESIRYAHPDETQLQVYESLRRYYAREVTNRIQQEGLSEARMYVLEAMLRLRQAAILPRLVDQAYRRIPSAKLELLFELLTEIKAEGNSALVYSQFVSVIDAVERRLRRSSDEDTAPHLFRLDGSTPQRQREQRIASFQETEEPAVFLISLKAGGLGINLTAADYVLLLDPWWNPAVEAQAIDRAHRIGRERPVIAYRLITAGTIEEKMLRLQERKRELSEAIVQADTGSLQSLSRDDIAALFEA